jgi:ketosteroid isomerase-like protein
VNSTSSEQEVLARAAELVHAFGAHDREAYFSFFDPAATFVFPTGPFLASRAAYEEEWAGWEASGWRVLACSSTGRRADEIAEDVVVYTHRVRTRVRDADGEHELDERETIVFRRVPIGAWTAVHEHLSTTPEGV